jgi:aminoglycoside 3-N-acetyltransferase
VKAALIEAGVRQDDVLLGHFALSWFGYLEGGAEGLIDTLLDILGPGGTLVMPTFSFSWLGREPFDPLTTPSREGAVTDRFWRRAGVVRSAHTTHSFAAFGKHAPAIVAGHDHTRSPLSEDGPLGRLEALNARILMFAPLNANTAMHVGEWRAGIPLLDLICPIMGDGVRREVLVPNCPRHVEFQPACERLFARNQIHEAVLGEQTVRTMLCRDAIAAQEEVMREMPELQLQPGCDCAYCVKLLEYCKTRS